MNTTVRLSAQKVRTLMDLQHEVYETADRTLGRALLLEGVSRLVEASLGVFTIVHDFQAGGEMLMAETLHYGSHGPEQRDRLLAAYHRAFRDPVLALLATTNDPPRTCRRVDIIDDKTWYGDDFVNHARLDNDIDDGIYSTRRIGPHRPHVGIGMNREVGAAAYTEEDRELIDLVSTQSLWLFGRQHHEPSGEWRDLSRRQRETLDALLSGLSEKEVAKRLGVSAHTVHTYVKALYRRFDVHSRAELLARLAKR